MDGKLNIGLVLIWFLLCSMVIAPKELYAPYAETIVLSDSDIKAFPGCEGFGCDATGPRGTSNVYFITNLNDGGAGSFEQAFEDAETNGGGWIVPRVAGTMDFDGFYYLGPTNGDDADIHYVGQAAPYQGLQVRASSSTGSGKELRFTGSNFIVRHLKSTDAHAPGADGLKIGWNTGEHPMENIVLDHLSIRGAISRTISFSTKGGSNDYTPSGTYLRNVTISNCLFSDPIPPAPMHIIFFGENQTKMSFIKNILTNGKERHALNNGYGNQFEWINNYNYNYWEAMTTTIQGKVDAIGNIYDVGAADDTSGPTFRVKDCSTNACPDPLPVGVSSRSDYTGSQYYYTDNKDNDNADGNADYDTDTNSWTTYAAGARLLGGTYTPLSSADVWNHVKNNAGAGVGTAQGRDTFDQAKIDEITNTTGSRPTGRITVPTLTSGGAGAAYTDTDGDGLSDAYETAQGGNVNIQDRPTTAVIANGDTIDQTGVTAGIRYSHGDIFFADLAGDWDNFSGTPAEVVGGAKIRDWFVNLFGTNGPTKYE